MPKCRQRQTGCEGEFEKWTGDIMRQATCLNPACLIHKGNKNKEKREAKQRKRDRRRKQEMKPLSDWLAEAQAVCNRYIRLRDAGDGCISCGKVFSGKYDAGHYVTVAHSSELRFHPMNIHKQCSWDCNSNKSGNIVEYRKALVKKIGVGNVEWLENHHDYYEYTIEDAKEIKAHYKELIKHLEADHGG